MAEQTTVLKLRKRKEDGLCWYGREIIQFPAGKTLQDLIRALLEHTLRRVKDDLYEFASQRGNAHFIIANYFGMHEGGSLEIYGGAPDAKIRSYNLIRRIKKSLEGKILKAV